MDTYSLEDMLNPGCRIQLFVPEATMIIEQRNHESWNHEPKVQESKEKFGPGLARIICLMVGSRLAAGFCGQQYIHRVSQMRTYKCKAMLIYLQSMQRCR